MDITDLTRGFLSLSSPRGGISTGTVTGPVVVVPLPPPVITQPPVAVIGQMGGAVKLTITATGATGYQWQKQDPLTNAWAPVANGTNVKGATTATLEISNAAAGDAGKYRCVVSNKDRSTDSAAVNVQVIAAPGISTQPVDTQQTAPGVPVALTVLATGNVTGYQWKRGTADAPYPSAKSSTLTIPAADVAAGAAFDWWCEVTGPGGTTATNKVKISEAIVIKLPPVITQPIRDTGAEAGSAARFMTHATGTGTLRYTWKYSAADGTGVTTIANGDQTFGTVTVKWSGADTNDLNLDAAPLALNGFKVWVEITDDNGATASDKVTFTVTKPDYIALVSTTGGTYAQTGEGVMTLELEQGKEFTGYIRSIPSGQPPTDNNSGFSATVAGADSTIGTAAITGTMLRIRGVAPGVMVLAITSGANSGKLTVTIKAATALPAAAAPVFAPDLLDQTIADGGAFTLTFDASPMTSFVWEEKNAQGVWVALAETTKTFTQANQTPGARTIRVVATNAPAGSSPTATHSHEATVTVNKPNYMTLIDTTGGTFAQTDEGTMALTLNEAEVFTGNVRNIPGGRDPFESNNGFGSTLSGVTPATATASIDSNRVLTITGVAAGSYTLTVTGGDGKAKGVITITVVKPQIRFKTQPLDAHVDYNASAAMRVEIDESSGTPPFSYMWKYQTIADGAEGDASSGVVPEGTYVFTDVTSDTLAVDHAFKFLESYRYLCVVTDSKGVTGRSNTALWVVGDKPTP